MLLPGTGLGLRLELCVFQGDLLLLQPLHCTSNLGMYPFLKPSDVAGPFLAWCSTCPRQASDLYIRVLATAFAPQEAACKSQVVAVVYPGSGSESQPDRLIQLVLVVEVVGCCGCVALAILEPIHEGAAPWALATPLALP